MKALTKAGVDEIALFILTPSPGSQVYDAEGGPEDLASMTFSPTWRKDYKKQLAFRKELYFQFMKDKARYHPLKLLTQPLHVLTGRYRTKMEMTPMRLIRTMIRAARAQNV